MIDVDPATIITALSTGAAIAAGHGAAEGLTETVKQGIADAYVAVKRAIRGRFGDDEEAKEKLAQLEMRPEDPGLQQALTGYLESHDVGSDPTVSQALQQLYVQLAKIEGGVSSISSGDVRDNKLTADRGGIAAVNITGGATAGYSPPPGGNDPH